MTDRSKGIQDKVITSLVTAAILGIFAYFMGVFEKGNEAIDKEQIRSVLEEVLVTDAGKTYAETLADVNGTLIAIDTKVGIIQTDVSDLEAALLDLARE